MWTVAGVLLAFVVITTLIGFHVGPHSHLATGVIGTVAAAWLLLMAVNGYAQPLLWVAFGADTALTIGFGAAAVRGLRSEHAAQQVRRSGRIVGAEAVAETDLDPEGIVRVRGESWSATSANGRVPRGSKLQVIEVKGLRLVVWAEDNHPALASSPFQLEQTYESGDQPEERRTGTS